MKYVGLLDNELRRTATENARTVLGRVRGSFYSGGDVYCSVCDGRYSRFLSFRGRRGASCPRCGSLERHRHAMEVWKRETNLFRAPLRVLHVAPESSLEPVLRKQDNLEYVTGDITPGRADRVVDLTNIDAADESFDVVLCSHVLEHIVDDVGAMSEIRRILRPDGWAYLSVPFDPSRDEIYEDPALVTAKERAAAFGQWDHVRWYSEQGFLTRVELAGLKGHVLPGGSGSDLNVLCTKRA